MSIDPKRLEEYKAEIAAIQKRVSFGEFGNRIFEKIFDFARLNNEQDYFKLLGDVDSIFSKDYQKFVQAATSKYDEILKLTNDYYEDIGGDVRRDFDKIKRLETINRTNLGDYKSQTVKKIAKTISGGVYKEYDWMQLSNELKKLKGKTETFADVIAQTQLKGYSRLAKAEKARIGGVEYFLYAGIIRESTRKFCLEHAGNHYHIEEINAMDNGPKQLKPVLVYCGGWRCIHDLEPDPFYSKSFSMESVLEMQSDERKLKEAEMKIQKFAEGRSKAELNTLNEYTDMHYLLWNSHLTGRKLTLEELNKLENYDIDDDYLKTISSIERLSEFLKQAPKYSGDVYRNMSFQSEEKMKSYLRNITKNKAVTFYEFLSCSASIDVTKVFKKSSNLLIQIKSKSGVYLDGLSQYPSEQEVLFNKRTKFKLIGVSRGFHTTKILLEEK